MATALSTISTATGVHTTRHARRARQQRPQRPQPAALSFLSLVGLRRHLLRLRRQMFDLDQDIASMTHTCMEMCEASEWSDPRLPALRDTIAFFEGRYRALDAQRAACVALYVRLLCA